VSSVPDLDTYDRIVVAYSGGKDSLACLLHLIDVGVDMSRVELWHHDIDGQGGPGFMDWPVTPDYVRAVAKAFDLPLFFSWKEGGFLRELLRDGERTAPIAWEEPAGVNGDVLVRRKGGTRGKLGTRLMFPQVTADLRTRWCSAYLKIDVARRILCNDPRFAHQRTLLITGERAEESKSRSRYKVFEAHESDARKGRKGRHVDRWRPVHGWEEELVWDAAERHKIRPHPAYTLGWGRLSCAGCIFGNKHQWASFRKVLPERFEQIAKLEVEFGKTIHRKLNVVDLADAGDAYKSTGRDDVVEVAVGEHWPQELGIKLDEGAWTLPSGAFGDSTGPT